MIPNSQIEIINGLAKTQFKSFCATFFHILGLTNINAVLVRENGAVTGKGTIDLGIVMSYRFVFLGKQHVGAVPDHIIQEIRETMDRETDKGIVLTTGYFSREAKRQAKIKGKLPIDLIDGSNLIERLKKYCLSVSIDTGEVFLTDKEKKP